MRNKSKGNFLRSRPTKNRKFWMMMNTLSSKIYEMLVLIDRFHAKIVSTKYNSKDKLIFFTHTSSNGYSYLCTCTSLLLANNTVLCYNSPGTCNWRQLVIATLYYVVDNVWIRGHFVNPLTFWLKCWQDSACKGFNSGLVCPQLWSTESTLSVCQYYTLFLCIGSGFHR